ncbi:MFS transporter [Kineococcus sp. R86509]|uniref:MFS transporter n=1 Tax=Kineococcus sp. R86509 TaxID=3093851 RepID=UPI0036D295BD
MTPAAAEATADPTGTTARESRGRATFAALRVRNFRIYATGQAFANTGVWVQNIALDWLTLELTHSPAAVGITMALTFLPILVFGMYGGMIADRYPKRNILLVTQLCSASIATTLAVLTISGNITVGTIYALAVVTGFVIALDNPTRQAFVGEVVPAEHIRNAVALNAAVFQTTRLVGPAVSSVLIGTVGSGWAFAVNALLYVGPTITLASMNTAELRPVTALPRAKGQLRSALRYVADRPHVGWTIALVGVFGTFGLNFPVVLTAMASETFHAGAGLYGTFNIVLAVGSIAGALIAGGRSHSRLRLILLLGAAFGAAQTLAAFAPNLATFMVVLVVMGVTNLAFQAIANSSVQLWVDQEYRGRVMGLYVLVFMGGTPIGGPIVGWITEHVGVRAGMAVCGIVPLAVAVAMAGVLAAQPVLARRRETAAALAG